MIDITSYPVRPVLSILLEDKTTKQNIVFATDSYASLGDRYTPEKHIDLNVLLDMDTWQIQPRVLKGKQDQADRTKTKAEVMTPSWVANRMNNDCDEDWFGYHSVFNTECDQSWTINEKPICFPKGKTWQDYVLSMRLEVACGEAPYLVSRYDTTTGKIIVPVENRIGVLDRKLRIVNENTDTKEDWLKYALSIVCLLWFLNLLLETMCSEEILPGEL